MVNLESITMFYTLHQCNRRLCGLIPSYQERDETRRIKENWMKVDEVYSTKLERKDVPFYYPECMSYKKVQGLTVTFNRYKHVNK